LCDRFQTLRYFRNGRSPVSPRRARGVLARNFRNLAVSSCWGAIHERRLSLQCALAAPFKTFLRTQALKPGLTFSALLMAPRTYRVSRSTT